MPEPEGTAAPAGGKVDSIVKHCVYEIATGAWAAGDKLPSLRRGEALWTANHLTVLRAYRRLEELGLVRREPRRGFFVAPHETSDRLRSDRQELDALYESVRATLLKDGSRSVVGAFRYLAEVAHSRARRQPECAFVECTAFQAEGHAREVRARLELPCLALRTEQLAAAPPPGVRFVLTTSFHVAEVAEAVKGTGIEALSVPIELCAEVLSQLVQSAGEIAFFATDGDHAHHIARDAAPRLGAAGAVITAQSCRAADVDGELAEALPAGGGGRRVVVLSPSLWTAASESWRRDRRVVALACQVVPSIWGQVADVLGLPLRSLA